MAIDLTDTEHNSDGLSDDPVALSDVDLLPIPSCFVCDGHFAASGPFSRCILQCCSIPSRCSASPTWSTSPVPPATLSPCRRVHDLFRPSIHGIFLQSALLPSAHSLQMPGSVSPFLRRPLPFLHTGPRPDPLVADSLEHLDIPIDFNAAPCELCAQFSQCP